MSAKNKRGNRLRQITNRYGADATNTERGWHQALFTAMANKMADRKGFSFKRWVRAKQAKQAGNAARRTVPLSATQRIERYQIQDAVRVDRLRAGGAVVSGVLTAAQVRRILSKAAGQGPEALAEARRALAGMRVRGRSGVLYPHLVNAEAGVDAWARDAAS